jgi:hypothetical protein
MTESAATALFAVFIAEDGKVIAEAAMNAAATVHADRFMFSFFKVIPPDRNIKLSLS